MARQKPITTAARRALLERIVERAKRAILADRRAGRIPPLKTLRGLGAHVDQNTYFLNRNGNLDHEVVVFGRANGLQPMLDFLGEAQAQVDHWLRSGALAEWR